MKHFSPAPFTKNYGLDHFAEKFFKHGTSPVDGGNAGGGHTSATLAPTVGPIPKARTSSHDTKVKPLRRMRMSGYRPVYPALYRIWNFTLAGILMIATLPLLCIIAAALTASQGPRNILYFGPRVGKDKKPFHIIKFKTLRDEVEQMTRDKTLPAGSNMETLLGKPLRDTRLDELPQLLNVLRGDMNILGPRPVRQSIAEKCRQTISDYDTRFEVKPGLIGYTQALMPHSTDKSIRARLNFRLCRRPVSIVQETLFVAVTGLSVLRWIGRVVKRSAVMLLPSALRKRSRGRGALGVAQIDLPNVAASQLQLLRIDEEKLYLEANLPLQIDPDRSSLPLRLRTPSRGRSRSKTALCIADLLSVEPLPNANGQTMAHRYSMRYTTASPFQHYMIERYFIGNVLVE